MHVWDSKYLTACTKVKIYEICVLLPPLYGSGTRASHAVGEHKLSSFNICFLRKLPEITWRGKVPNMNILRCCSMVSLQVILKWHRLHWFSHVFHMYTDCLPQETIYGELANAKWNRGHPRLFHRCL